MIRAGEHFTVAELDESIAMRLGGSLPRPMARMMTDGGTSFCIRSDSREWHPEFQKTVDWLTSMSEAERRSRKQNATIGLPLPPVPGRAPELVLEGEEVEREWSGAVQLDPRRLGWAVEAGSDRASPKVAVEAWMTGSEYNPCIHLHAGDRMFCTLNRRADVHGLVLWEARVQAKAPELYADGLNLWMVRWLGLFGWLLHGKFCAPSEAHKLGWRTTQWHLNSDFTHLHMLTGDVWKVCGWRGGRAYGDRAKAPGRAESAHMEVFKKANPYFASTLYLGRTTSDTCLVVYRKCEQLEDEAKIAPASSMYAPHWVRAGWDGTQDVTRVEARLRKKGLQYRCPMTDEVVYDFRDPMLLLSEEARGHLWGHLMEKRRLTCPTAKEAHAKRLTRSKVDPAWMEVMRLGEDTPARALRQVSREIRELTRRERMAKSQKAAASAAIHFATQHGASLRDWNDVGGVLVAMGKRMSTGGEPEEMEALPRAVKVADLGDYAKHAAVFFREQADAAFEDFESEVEEELVRVDWSAADVLKPPIEDE